MDDAHFSDPWELYWSRQDWLSHRFTWHQQHLNERCLDLQGFLASVSTALEDERLDYSKHTFPLGFYEVEQPSRIRYAGIVFLFTIFERRVRALCRLIEETDPKPGPKLDDLRGTLTERLKEFFRIRLSVEVGSKASWNSIQNLQKVRDCIIHCGGQVSESRDATFLKSLATKDSGVSLSAWGYLLIEARFYDELEGSLFPFFDENLPEAHRQIRERILAKQSMHEPSQ